MEQNMNRLKRVEISGAALRDRITQPNLNGSQRMQYAIENLTDEQFMIYNDIKVARRITIPMCNERHVKDCIQVLRNTVRELDNLIKGRTHLVKNYNSDDRMDQLRKIIQAQLIIVGAGSELKRRASPSGLGFNDGSFMGVR